MNMHVTPLYNHVGPLLGCHKCSLQSNKIISSLNSSSALLSTLLTASLPLVHNYCSSFKCTVAIKDSKQQSHAKPHPTGVNQQSTSFPILSSHLQCHPRFSPSGMGVSADLSASFASIRQEPSLGTDRAAWCLSSHPLDRT